MNDVVREDVVDSESEHNKYLWQNVKVLMKLQLTECWFSMINYTRKGTTILKSKSLKFTEVSLFFPDIITDDWSIRQKSENNYFYV